MAFYELTADETAIERDRITHAALTTARVIAAQHLIDGPAGHADDPTAVADILSARDHTDPRYENLSYFEKHWALLTLNLLTGVLSDPSAAVRDAHARGASVSEIASALGITDNGVYKRYADIVVRRPRKRT